MSKHTAKSRARVLRGLMRRASVLTLGAAAIAAPAAAQTVVVVGAPEGSAPGAVGDTALKASVNLGSNGRLIFNHTDNNDEGYVVAPLNTSGQTLSIGGAAGSVMDFVAGHTVLTQRPPERGLSASPPGEKATVFQPGSGGFGGEVIIRNGAELEVEQYYTLTTRFQGSGASQISTVLEGDTFAGQIFGGKVTVERAGRLTGQGSLASSSGDFTIAGILSPNGFPDHTQSSFEGPNGKFLFGSNLSTNTLRFTPTSIYEVDVDFTLPDGKLANDTISSQAQTTIEDGAQLLVRLHKPVGQTNYLVGRTFRILDMTRTSFEAHYYNFTWATVAGVTRPPQVTIFLDMTANPGIKSGDKIQRVFNGQTYTFTYSGAQTNTVKRDLSGNFTLASNGDTQLTRYLGLELRDGTRSATGVIPKNDGTTDGISGSLQVRSYLELAIVQNRFFVDDATTGNGRSSATALQSIGDQNGIYTRLMNLPTDSPAVDQLSPFFDSLSGQLHVDVRGLLAQDAYSMQRTVGRRMSMHQPSGGVYLWGEALGASSELKDSGEAPKIRQEGYGLLVGLDATLTGAWRVGAAGGYRTAEARGPDAAVGEADIDQWYGLVYTSGAWGNLRGRAGAGVSTAAIDTDRSIFLTDVVDERLTAKYDGTVVNAFGELGYGIGLGGGAEVEPFLGYNYVRASTDPVRESESKAGANGIGALLISGDQTQVQFATLGARARTLGDGPVSFDGMLGWRRGFGDLDLEGQHLLNNREYIAVRGASLSENAVVAELAASWRATDHLTLDARYEGIIGEESSDHTLRAGASLRF